MKSIDRRVMEIEKKRGIGTLPDFERMTPEQRDPGLKRLLLRT